MALLCQTQPELHCHIHYNQKTFSHICYSEISISVDDSCGIKSLKRYHKNTNKKWNNFNFTTLEQLWNLRINKLQHTNTDRICLYVIIIRQCIGYNVAQDFTFTGTRDLNCSSDAGSYKELYRQSLDFTVNRFFREIISNIWYTYCAWMSVIIWRRAAKCITLSKRFDTFVQKYATNI